MPTLAQRTCRNSTDPGGEGRSCFATRRLPDEISQVEAGIVASGDPTEDWIGGHRESLAILDLARRATFYHLIGSRKNGTVVSEPGPAAASHLRHQELVVGCILLLLAEQPSHGYGLLERLKDLMPSWELSAGNLYRDLRKLEADGLVVSVWEASQTRGPARRVYEITQAGQDSLEEWVRGTRRLIGMLDGCLALHRTLPLQEPRRRPRPRRR